MWGLPDSVSLAWKLNLFIHSIRIFLSIHFVLGTVINARDVEITETAKSLYHGA